MPNVFRQAKISRAWQVFIGDRFRRLTDRSLASNGRHCIGQFRYAIFPPRLSILLVYMHTYSYQFLSIYYRPALNADAVLR